MKKKWALYLFLAALLAALFVWGAMVWGPAAPSDEILVKYVLSETDFLAGHSELFIGATNVQIISPRQPYDKLFLKAKHAAPNTGLQISSPKDLVGKVHITTPRQALQYARLFTSPDIGVRLGGDAWGEVVPISSLDIRYFFGNKDLLKARKEDPEAVQRELRRGLPQDIAKRVYPPHIKHRSGGVLTDKEWKANGFRAPEVKKAGQGFIVRRTLFKVPQEKDYTYQAYWVEEKISPNGKSTRKVITKVGTKDKIRFGIVHERY